MATFKEPVTCGIMNCTAQAEVEYVPEGLRAQPSCYRHMTQMLAHYLDQGEVVTVQPISR